MEIKEFTLANGILVDSYENAFNAECDIAIVKQSVNYEKKIRIGCEWLYNEVITYKALSTKFDNIFYDYLIEINGELLSKDEDFDSIMNNENLKEALGNVRIQKIIFQTKKVVNARDCEPCDC